MFKVDYLFYDAIVVTMADKTGCGIINNGAVAVKGKYIVEVGSSEHLKKRYQAKYEIDCKSKVVMPGLIDAHMHSEVSIYRGLAQDSQNWMSDCVFPLRACLDDNSSEVGSMLMIGEAIKAGTTTLVDQNIRMNLLAENHFQAGNRAVICQTVNALTDKVAMQSKDELYQFDFDRENELFEESKKLLERWNHVETSRILCGLNPQGPDRVSIAMMDKINRQSKNTNSIIFMHLACGERENNQMQKRYQKRTIPFLNELGIIHNKLIGIHLSIATLEELRIFANAGAGMVLCSGSEAIVDGNIPPAYEFNQMSPRLAIGSDQTSGGNNSNMFFEMKVGALLNKCKFNDPEIFQAWKMLRLATIDGARTLGLEKEIGSLEEGKKADLIVIDMTRLNMIPIIYEPLRNIIPNLVYAANGSEVEMSMVDGKIIMNNRKLTNIDEEKLVHLAQIESQKLMERVGKTALEERETVATRLKKENKL